MCYSPFCKGDFYFLNCEKKLPYIILQNLRNCKNLQNCKNVLTYGKKRCIIYEHELSVEAKCGYILQFRKDGGNFGGVCYGKDQAVRNVLIPELSCVFWVFIKVIFETPERVLNCQGNFDSKPSYLRQKPKKEKQKRRRENYNGKSNSNQ